MSDGRAVKQVFLGKPDGRRKAGRPKLRWLDCTENDLKSMCVKRWRKKAEDMCVCRRRRRGGRRRSAEI
jgi:hypothetical protein